MAKLMIELDGRSLVVTADETPEYMQQVCDQVNRELSQVRSGARSRSSMDCYAVASLNLSDQLLKERAAAEALRTQLMQALEDNRRLEQQLKDKGVSPQKNGSKGKKR